MNSHSSKEELKKSLRAFLKNSTLAVDDRVREYPLIDEMKNLRSILGLAQS